MQIHLLDHPTAKTQFEPILHLLETAIDGIDKAEFQATMKIERPQIPIIIDEVVEDISYLQKNLTDKDNLEIVKRTKADYTEALYKTHRQKLFVGGNQIITKNIRKLKHVQASIDAHHSVFHDFAATKKALKQAIGSLESFLDKLHFGQNVPDVNPRGGLEEYIRRHTKVPIAYHLVFKTLESAIAELKTLQSQLKK